MMTRKIKEKGSGKQSAQTRVSGTRDRIIKRSIALFNRKGLRDVAVERIATDLRMSPGNVTYYFPRKPQLIAATLEVMQEHLRTALERPTDVSSAREGADYLIRLYRTLWDFRFFFNSLTYVLTNPQLRREYTAFHDWAMRTIESDLLVLRDHGHFLPPVPPNTFPLLAENMWSLWLNWLRMQQIRTPLAVTPDNAAIYECALRNWSLCQPWMRLEYARDLLRVFGELLPH